MADSAANEQGNLEKLYNVLPSHTNEGVWTRLLTLHPGKGNEPIQCSLKPAQLIENSCVDYEALSYCWGDASQTADICCNGFQLSISANLYAALQSLRQQDRARVLWADALCICQADLDERADQVDHMCPIYSLASTVVIWLGEEEETTALAFSLAETLAKASLEEEVTSIDVSGTADLTNCGPNFRSFRQLLRRSWFKRMWVFQEAVLASRAVVKCGQKEMAFSVLARAIIFCMGAAYGTQWIPADVQTFVVSIEALRNGFNGLDSLSELLYSLRHTLATDPLDKIFALHGLSSFVGMERVSAALSSPGVRPNYRMSVEDLYMNVAHACISVEGNLNILSVPSAMKMNQNLPSWAADWRDFRAQQPSVGSWRRFSTSRSSSALCRREGKVLGLKGFLFDRIVRVTIGYDQLFNREEAMDNAIQGGLWEALRIFLHVCRDCADKTAACAILAIDERSQKVGSLQQALDLFWRTSACFNPDDIPKSLVSELRRSHRNRYYLGTLSRTMYRLAHYVPLLRLFVPIFFFVEMMVGDIFHKFLFTRSSYRFTSTNLTRPLAWTNQGHLANVPDSTKVGDSIAILSGGKVPLII